MAIGSHTWNHYHLAEGSIDDLAYSIDLLETALWKILGVKPSLFRAPYGEITDEQVAYINSRGYTVIGWSRDTEDSLGASVDRSIEIMNGAEENDIILAHEVIESTPAETIPSTIPGLVNRWVFFAGVDQCLGLQRYQAVGSYSTRDSTWTCDGTPQPGG